MEGTISWWYFMDFVASVLGAAWGFRTLQMSRTRVNNFLLQQIRVEADRHGYLCVGYHNEPRAQSRHGRDTIF